MVYKHYDRLPAFPSPLDGYKPFCEHPVIIINSQLPEYFLTHVGIRAINEYGSSVNYVVPMSVCIIAKLKEKKKELKQWLSIFVRKRGIKYFVDSTGEIISATMYVECGKCLCCREKKRKHFEALCSLECQEHDYLPLFITLTYNDYNVPEEGLRVKDVQDFFKRVRRGLDKRGFTDKIKYAYCGEYGTTNTKRPHYHILLYGFPQSGVFSNYYKIDEFIKAKWNKGFILVKPCNDIKAGRYIAKYMTKQTDVPLGYSVKPFVRHSYNMGVNFVKSVVEKVLPKVKEFVPIYYRDKFSGNVQLLPLNKYYMNRIVPTLTKVKSDVRNSIILVRYLAEAYSVYTIAHSDYVKDNELYDVYKGINLDLFAASYDKGIGKVEAYQAIEDTICYINTEIPYLVNKEFRDNWYDSLLKVIPVRDPLEFSYSLKKKNDKELNSQKI